MSPLTNWGLQEVKSILINYDFTNHFFKNQIDTNHFLVRPQLIDLQ